MINNKLFWQMFLQYAAEFCFCTQVCLFHLQKATKQPYETDDSIHSECES